jgi:hypothetical protein
VDGFGSPLFALAYPKELYLTLKAMLLTTSQTLCDSI